MSPKWIFLPAAEAGNSYLLDYISGTVKVAYSLRKIKSNYSSYVLRIRRSSDSVIVDVSLDANEKFSLDSSITYVSGGSGTIATNVGQFMAASGYTDADSLGSADSAYVVTWYDQSGNGNNATQSNTGRQPQIISSGSILQRSSKDAIRFNSSNDTFLESSTSLTSQNASAIVVGSITSGGTYYGRLISCTNGTATDWNNIGYFAISKARNYEKIDIVRNDISPTDESITWDALFYATAVYNSSGNGKWRIDGTDKATLTPTGNFNINKVYIGGRIDGSTVTDNLLGDIAEVIVVDGDETSNISDIESDISTYYGIS